MTKLGYLILNDFDGTIVDTFSPSPNGLDVRSAYQKALGDIFGVDLSETYFAQHPLDNRAPSEVARDFLNKFGWQQNLLEKAKDFHSRTETEAFPIPEAESGILWDDANPAAAISAMLVGQKLRYLTDEVGRGDGNSPWPNVFEQETVDFLNKIEELKKAGVPVETGIVSSGHDQFIRKTLELHGINFSGILLSDDAIRRNKYPREEDRRSKPGQLPLAMAHLEWIQRLEDSSQKVPGTRILPRYLQTARETKSRILVIGDSMSKDGKLAANAGVSFCLYQQGIYAKLLSDLNDNIHLLDGRPISEIFPKVGIMDKEINPRNLEGFYAARLGGSRERQ